MTPTAIVRQQAEASAERNILDQLKRPTLEMINAGHGAYGAKSISRGNGHVLSGQNIRKIFVAMIKEFENG